MCFTRSEQPALIFLEISQLEQTWKLFDQGLMMIVRGFFEIFFLSNYSPYDSQLIVSVIVA